VADTYTQGATAKCARQNTTSFNCQKFRTQTQNIVEDNWIWNQQVSMPSLLAIQPNIDAEVVTLQHQNSTKTKQSKHPQRNESLPSNNNYN